MSSPKGGTLDGMAALKRRMMELAISLINPSTLPTRPRLLSPEILLLELRSEVGETIAFSASLLCVPNNIPEPPPGIGGYTPDAQDYPHPVYSPLGANAECILSFSLYLDGWTNGWMERWTQGGREGCMDGCMPAWRDGCKDGLMHGCMDGWIDT